MSATPAWLLCRKLLAALSRNSVPDVEDILQTMQEDDLEPGPLAYNTLVVAHVKNGNLDAALDILQDLHYQGCHCVPSHKQLLAISV